MSKYKEKIKQIFKDGFGNIDYDIMYKIDSNTNSDDIEALKEYMNVLKNNLDIKFKLLISDTRNENQIWKDIYKKHFKKLNPNDTNSKINSLLKRGYLIFEYNNKPTQATKITYIFYPQLKKNALKYFDDTIIMYGSNNNIPIFKNKWILSKEEWELYPIVYEKFVLTDLYDESIFRSLFQRAKYKKEVSDYLSSLSEDSMVSIRVPKYDIDIEIENSMIPNKDLIDLFGFVDDLIYEDLRNEEVYLNNILFHV